MVNELPPPFTQNHQLSLFQSVFLLPEKPYLLKFTLLFSLLFCCIAGRAQNQPASKAVQGVIIGSLLDTENGKALAGASVSISRLSDSAYTDNTVTVKDGAFIFDHLPFGYYRLQFSMTGYAGLTLDSIYIRADRYDFDLNDIKLNRNATTMNAVVVYAEKPLIESKDGKITFNAGESALSSGATTTELLKQTPLVNVDSDGKILIRGKDVKVLIDDKPVELNAKQLQDMLESMPGSMIEKIEVMTTPPAQYASERGGVINIVTKKGKVGMNARINVNYGTRGEAGVSGNFNYRKKQWTVNFNAGFGYNEYHGNGYSKRQNLYTDSSNYFNTVSSSNSNNRRPNGRLNVEYEINKRNNIGFTAQYNGNDASSGSDNEYSNINRFSQLYKISTRSVRTGTTSYSPNFNFTYTYKGKNVKEVLRFITGWNFNNSNTDRDFYQQYFYADHTPTGTDSTQEQLTRLRSNTLSFRLNYDKPIIDNKLTLNTGGNILRTNTRNTLGTSFLRKPDNVFVPNNGLSNDFVFHQLVYAFRAALRYDFTPEFYINAGTQAEHTGTGFDVKNDPNDYGNDYWSLLPFVTLMKKWSNEVSITFSYKRTIQRPGLNELNPSVDYSDPNNTRSGNPGLQPYYADNFDFIVGKWNKLYYLNASVGYNTLRNIYSSLRTLLPDGKTFTSWQNISGRQEYEGSIWGGLTLNKKAKANLSLGYTYNVYSDHDRKVRYFRNGGSFYSTLNGSYQFSDVMNANGSFTYNRFANPQGTLNNNLSMNVGLQRKFFEKKFIVAINIIDPFSQQQNRTFTYGSNFNLESYSRTNTRNYRIALSYIFNKSVKKTNKLANLKKAKK